MAAVREADNLAEKKRVESLIGMADVANVLAHQALKVFHDSGFTSLQVAIAQLDDALNVIRIGLDAVPLHEIGSGHAVSALILLRTSCGHLQRGLDRAEAWRESHEPAEGTFDWYDYDTGAIRLCCSNIQQSSHNLTKALREI